MTPKPSTSDPYGKNRHHKHHFTYHHHLYLTLPLGATMNQITKSCLLLIAFNLVLAAAYEAISCLTTHESTVTVLHDEVEIEFVEDVTAMNEYEYETLNLRAER